MGMGRASHVRIHGLKASLVSWPPQNGGSDLVTRIWTAGFCPCLHLSGFDFGYIHFDPRPNLVPLTFRLNKLKAGSQFLCHKLESFALRLRCTLLASRPFLHVHQSVRAHGRGALGVHAYHIRASSNVPAKEGDQDMYETRGLC